MGLQDWLDTVLEYLKVFAWPAVVLTLALIYRKPLIGVLKRLHKATGFGATVELERLEDDARALNEAELPELMPAEGVGAAIEDEELEVPQRATDEPADATSEFKRVWGAPAIRRFWATNPETAAQLGIAYPHDRDSRALSRDAENYGRMMLAWARLETKAVKLGELLGVPTGPARNLGVLSGKLLDGGHISHEAAEIARSLQRLRNELVHEVENISISSSLTADFVGTAEKLDRLFDQVIDELEA